LNQLDKKLILIVANLTIIFIDID